MNAHQNHGEAAIGYRDGQLTTGGAPSAPADSSGHSHGSLSFGLVLTAIKRQKLLIAGMGLLGLLLGALLFMATEKVYQSIAQIEVNPETLRAVEVEGQPGQSAGIDQTYLDTQAELLRTRALRERVARKLKLDLNPAIANPAGAPKGRIDAAVGWLEQSVSVENLGGTRLFAIGARSSDPQLATRVANQYVSEFISLNIERQLETSAYARSYLGDQIAETKANLEQSERALVEYARDREIVTLSSVDNPQGGESLATKSLSELNSALVGARARRIATQERLRFNSQESQQANPQAAALEAQLAQLRAEYRQKRDLFKPDYPEMVALKQKIDSLEQSSKSVTVAQSDAERRKLESDYQAAAGEEKQLSSQVAALKSTALNERQNSIQYNILKRDVDTNAAQYDALLERFKQIGTAGTQVQNLISVVDPATVPRSPVSPILGVNLALGLIGGLAVGLGIALLSSMLSTRVRSQRDVDQLLDQTFIGSVPSVDGFENIALELKDPKTPIYEAFVSIANRLRFATSHGFPKTLSLTSTVPNEGKSSTAYGVSQILARQGRRVLLIDADLRMPTFLNFERGDAMPMARDQSASNQGRGLSDILIGDVTFEQARITLSDKLDLIPSGEVPPNPAELLIGQNFSSLINAKAQEYDHVVIDAPPILGLADSPIVASLVEGTIFVVQANRSTSQQIRSAIRRLTENSGHILGVVLTQTAANETGDEYGYDYHYSYGSNSKTTEQRGLGKVLGALRR